MTTVLESQDLVIMGVEAKGIILDNTESKFFDNSTVHAVGLIKIDKGNVTGSFFGKYLDPGGDFYVIESSQAGTELNRKFIYGTGNLKKLQALVGLCVQPKGNQSLQGHPKYVQR